MDTSLDYRQNYPYSPYARNPLTWGQWAMIAAGALAVGGMSYWVYAKFIKKSGTEALAQTA